MQELRSMDMHFRVRTCNYCQKNNLECKQKGDNYACELCLRRGLSCSLSKSILRIQPSLKRKEIEGDLIQLVFRLNKEYQRLKEQLNHVQEELLHAKTQYCLWQKRSWSRLAISLWKKESSDKNPILLCCNEQFFVFMEQDPNTLGQLSILPKILYNYDDPLVLIETNEANYKSAFIRPLDEQVFLIIAVVHIQDDKKVIL